MKWSKLIVFACRHVITLRAATVTEHKLTPSYASYGLTWL